MTLDLIDTHTHLDAQDFDSDREDVIARAREAGVSRFISIGAGYGFESAKRVIDLIEKYEFIWATVGLHPHDTDTPLDLGCFADLSQHPKVVALGETGLDFFRDWAPREMQEKWFRSQLELAHDRQMPVIIHSRDAGRECLEILKEMEAEKLGGVFHCYSEDADFAKELVEMNFMLSIPGTITYKKADELRDAVREIPLEQIMLETDAPYLAPTPYRGKRNETAYMVETARAVADLKDMSIEECARITTENAVKFFNLPPLDKE